ncbi:ATP-binding protein [Mycobacterium angelicum]|uniref:Adenylate/guanylate cyclase domain-containing protein n=1 Tax=Mycobacterium angelicum TaxID=470074 RepID=A0A1W9ZSN1_MYCAN|nr:adenylate/guanylate cyclase domain-containing protein [Mycobacterium angelicum]MCV7196950.1 adenylate/guanylate cyclase domain-containing protein [Mycobacterium angelicum]ORA20809.1 adenylate/guanylate cyclase domain-containing protein [Mycobacterium angelicum]
MSAPSAAAPSGVVTFLFTDVEGSTGRWEADPDAMRAALAAHDKVLRDAIEAHGGWFFKHTGDGACAAFSSPKSAVDAAVAAQRQLELPVRMGLATGEAELRDRDYFGAVLNRAARVMAAGHGGQILLAESTAALLSGVDLVDLGRRRLRGVPVAVEVFQVRAAGLPTEFPPLRALDTTQGNLRPAPTRLIGRESEVGEIEATLKAHRLVTLTGVGGVGKTRLGLEVAARLIDEFPDGVWVFELAAVTDPAAVPDAVAAVMGITQQPDKSVSESVAAALEGRVRLLVIDNCEHVLDAAADLIEAILRHSPTVTILATSREGLGVPNEQVWPVPSLDVRPGIDSSAVSLFLERAQGLAPHFVPTTQEADAIVEICRRLDGIPLAIELAASRMSSMTAGEMRDRLGQPFRLLVGSRRSLERHHTLRHAVQWSYDLLHDAEKALLDRCSVFAGGFDIQSACAVSGFDEADDSRDYVVLDLVDALVRKSLLVADRSAERTRFSMLETIRQFGEEQLVAKGEADDARAAQARYFAGREDDILALWGSPRQRDAYDWLATELANLRTAFRWAADRGDLDVAAPIATYAAWFGFLTENYEPIAWAEELIEPARATDDPRLTALYVLASNCYMAGRIDPGIRYTEAAERLITRASEFVPYGAEGFVGAGYVAVGQPERWIRCCRAQLGRSREDHTLTRACLVNALGVTGSVDEAMVAANGLIDAAQATGNPFALSWALSAFGFVFYDADPVGSLISLRRGLAIAQDSGNRFNLSILAYNLGRVEAEHGDPLAAFDCFTLAIGNFHDSGNTYMIRTPLGFLAAFFDRLERYEPAATIAGFAVTSPLAALPVMAEFETAIAHLRNVLGEATYTSLARKGEAMTTAQMVRYAYDQIDQARTELERPD